MEVGSRLIFKWMNWERIKIFISYVNKLCITRQFLNIVCSLTILSKRYFEAKFPFQMLIFWRRCFGGREEKRGETQLWYSRGNFDSDTRFASESDTRRAQIDSFAAPRNPRKNRVTKHGIHGVQA